MPPILYMPVYSLFKRLLGYTLSLQATLRWFCVIWYVENGFTSLPAISTKCSALFILSKRWFYMLSTISKIFRHPGQYFQTWLVAERLHDNQFWRFRGLSSVDIMFFHLFKTILVGLIVYSFERAATCNCLRAVGLHIFHMPYQEWRGWGGTSFLVARHVGVNFVSFEDGQTKE